MISVGIANNMLSHLSLRSSFLVIKPNVARHPFFWGIVFMIAATSLWALAFAAPLAIPDASATEVALGRFIVYGLISVVLFPPSHILSLPRHVIVIALIYALAGNIAYYILLVLGIQLAGAALSVLVIGMLPVTISIAGSFRTGRARLAGLAGPLLLFVIGLCLFNLAKTNFFQEVSDISFTGLVCLIASLVMWTWYAVSNARFLKDTKFVTAAQWSSVVGVMSLLIAMVGLPLGWYLGFARDPSLLSQAEFQSIALWSILLGGGATWLGTILFNLASKLLDTALLGQLIVFEAIFGMIYVGIYAEKLPSLLEVFAILLTLLAVWLSIRKLQATE